MVHVPSLSGQPAAEPEGRPKRAARGPVLATEVERVVAAVWLPVAVEAGETELVSLGTGELAAR